MQVHHKKFTYAWCLIHLKAREDIQSGIALLQVWLSTKTAQRERRAGIVAVAFKDIFLCSVCEYERKKRREAVRTTETETETETKMRCSCSHLNSRKRHGSLTSPQTVLRQGQSRQHSARGEQA